MISTRRIPFILAAGLAAAAHAQAPPAGAEPRPAVWSSEAAGTIPVFVDASFVVAWQGGDVRVFDTATGKPLWDKKFEGRLEGVGATKAFVAVRTGKLVKCFDTRTGKDLHTLDYTTGMAVLGGRLFYSRSGEVGHCDPLKGKTSTLDIAVPFVPSTDPTRSAHTGEHVVWPLKPQHLLSYDFEKLALVWKHETGVFRYVQAPTTAAHDGDASARQRSLWDDVYAMHAWGDYVAVHCGHADKAPIGAKEAERQDYLWILRASSTGAGSRDDLDRNPKDKPVRPFLYWTHAVPKPMLIVRWTLAEAEDQARFDVYATTAVTKVKTRYLKGDTIAIGAKGQLVLSYGSTSGVFTVVALDKAAAPLWEGRGRLLPRRTEEGPYLVIRADPSGTNQLVQLEAATGKPLATLDLGKDAWDLIDDPTHLVVASSAGALWRVDPATLVATHRYTLEGQCLSVHALDPTTCIARHGSKLSRVSFR